MRKIPKKMRQEMADDRFYDLCCLRDVSTCKGAIQWHHNLLYEGKQVNEKFCILPVCKRHHENIHLPKAKYHADKIMLERASEQQKDEYDLHQLEDKLENLDTPWDERK